MSDQQDINFIDFKKLNLDKCDLRLPVKFRKSSPSKRDIINWMLNDASVIELMLSIGHSGFFIGEALLVVEEKKDSFVVIEGNRRLTSIILLNEPELANLHKKKIAKVLAETHERPNKIPCIIFSSRDEITKYLGYRHVIGVKSWGILQKARYLSDQRKNYVNLSLVNQCRELAKSIGSRSDHVKKLLVAYQIYKAIEDDDFFQIKDLDETALHFNYYADSLGHDNIRNFIHIDMQSEDPIANLNISNLKTLTQWFFEKNAQNKPRIIGDSKHLTMLNKVLSDKKATKYFESGSGSILDAYHLVSVTADTFNQEIEMSLAGLKRAQSIIHNVEQHHGTVKTKLKEIFSLAKSMNT